MSEFNDEFPDYEKLAHHSEEEGIPKRKKLWRVFWIMLALTIVELIIGFNAKSMGLLTALGTTTFMLKLIFVGATIAKAGYIVLSFMHLGDEKRALKYTIIAPYCLFVAYLIWIVKTEGEYTLDLREPMDHNIIEQRNAQNEEHGEHGAAATEEHGGAAKEEGVKEESHH